MWKIDMSWDKNIESLKNLLKNFKKEMMSKKTIRTLRWIVLILTIIPCIGMINPLWFKGVFWHLTHKSRINYNGMELTVPFGWFVKQGEGVRLSKDPFLWAGKFVYVYIGQLKGDKEYNGMKKQIEFSKKAAERWGYYPEESKIIIGKEEAILLRWKGSGELKYTETEKIFIPSRHIFISYERWGWGWGSKKDRKDRDCFQKILSSISFK